MTTWTTLPITRLCGRCGVSLPAGTRVQTIRIEGLKRDMVRCAACAMPAAPIEEMAGC